MDAANRNMENIAMPKLPAMPVREPPPPTRLPFRIRTLGRIRRQPYHVTAGTYHDDAMVTVVRDGRGLYYAAGEVMTVEGGYVGLVLPSSDPGLLMADPEAPYDHYYCRFGGREALRMAREIASVHGGASFFPSRRWSDALAVCESMLALEPATGSAATEWMGEGEAALCRLLALLLTKPTSKSIALGASSLRHYLAQHVSHPFDLEQMAAHFGTSRSHLSRRGHALLGEPLAVASRRLRLDLACSMLDASVLELSVSEVARRVGYDDPLHFSKVFRRHVGVSPRQYRQRKSG